MTIKNHGDRKIEVHIFIHVTTKCSLMKCSIQNLSQILQCEFRFPLAIFEVKHSLDKLMNEKETNKYFDCLNISLLQKHVSVNSLNFKSSDFRGVPSGTQTEGLI